MSNVRRDYFRINIEDTDQGLQFLDQLFSDNLLYHPDDNAEDIIHKDSEGNFVPLFSKDESLLLNDRMNEVFEYVEDPCQYILDNFYPKNIEK